MVQNLNLKNLCSFQDWILFRWVRFCVLEGFFSSFRIIWIYFLIWYISTLYWISMKLVTSRHQFLGLICMWRYISIYKIWIHCPSILAILLALQGKNRSLPSLFLLSDPKLFFVFLFHEAKHTKFPLHGFKMPVLFLGAFPHISTRTTMILQGIFYEIIHSFHILTLESFKFFLHHLNIWIFN